MRILNLKINRFGKLKNKEIGLAPHINLVYGKNESGKSTLLKYILSMFYGVSKNKNGKEISDMDKYTPWESEEFSGKIQYELDNGEFFEIYREFKKKNPKVFDQNSEDISKKFNIDKTKGNQFFYEQTKIEEELFLSTMVSEQQSVKLDSKSQNILIQKISNLIGTGEDTVSYQKTKKNLDKRLLEEVGTTRSQDRPINIIRKRISEVEEEKAYLRPYALEKYEIQQSKEEYHLKSKQLKNKIDLIKELKILDEKNTIEQEKIEVNKKIEKEYLEKLRELELKRDLKKQNQKEINNKKLLSPIITSAFSVMISVISFVVISNLQIVLALIAILGIINILYAFWYMKKQKKNKTEKTKGSDELLQIEKEIEITQKSHEEQLDKIKKMQETLNLNNSLEKQRIKIKYIEQINNNNINIDDHNLIMELNILQDQYQNQLLKIRSLELDEQNILPRLDKLAGLEEELEDLKEQEQELELKRDCIELAKEVIESSYQKMKSEVSPKFAEKISKQMQVVSNGKYRNIKLNDNTGFMVEIENGDYIPAEQLSVGTIDQLYLSLRLSSIEDITEEKMPILLDETFVYFDEERLENMLQYLHSNYPDRQILIFTCSRREKEVLDKLKISYNLVEM